MDKYVKFDKLDEDKRENELNTEGYRKEATNINKILNETSDLLQEMMNSKYNW